MTRAEDVDAAIGRAKDGRGTEAYYREAIGDRRLLAEEVLRLRGQLVIMERLAYSERQCDQ